MLIDIIPEIRDYKNLLKQARKTAKKRLGGQMTRPQNEQTEPLEEYRLALQDETKLEVAFMLREFAEKIERNTLKKK